MRVFSGPGSRLAMVIEGRREKIAGLCVQNEITRDSFVDRGRGIESTDPWARFDQFDQFEGIVLSRGRGQLAKQAQAFGHLMKFI